MNRNFARAVLLMAAPLYFAACTVDGFEQNSTSLTAEESLIASQIVGESVSENQSGLLSSFSEAFAIPATSGLLTGPSTLATGSFRNLENFTYAYNSDTGIHTASFSRQVTNPLQTTSTDYILDYKFFDSSGNIIANPDNQRQQIAALEFSATQNGEIVASDKQSIFTRTDRLYIDGVTTTSEFLSIDGFHSGEGLFSQLKSDGTQIEREYFLDINYLNIRINNLLVQNNRNFRSGVSGAFSYEQTIRQRESSSAQLETKIVNGTVELNGDGTALLKFREQPERFRMKLADGEIFDEDEFEGRVTRVNLQDQIFTLSNGQRIQINNQTELKIKDFASLAEVALAVENGVRIIAEGDYFYTTIRSVANGERVLPAYLTESLFAQIIEKSLSEPDIQKNILESVQLTQREQQVIKLIAEGLSNKEIAQKLFISPHTIKSHVHNILEKLTLNSRMQIALYAHGSSDFSSQQMFTVWESTTNSPAIVNLGTAGNFVLLAKTATSTVPASAITGDVGISPAAGTYITGFNLTDAIGFATTTQVTG